MILIVSLAALTLGVVLEVVGGLWAVADYQAQEAAGLNGDGPRAPFVLVAAYFAPALMIVGVIGTVFALIVGRRKRVAAV
ncbi:hypothetical protein NH287_11005 [Microbacterium sp. CnD16-F]|uniref:hypothetical protein n=1 Tax=unclassified Microbacterium TaxID=2609290 RepID=UPI001C2F9BCC|nr:MULTISPECIES: hypothetical protein [unclassified Microbacterium]MCO7204014.1 hypothetical protein [Microbacterium sp. CnD16-F]MDT0180668.1 hypothetical protein [Microbacterium sp. ARD31]